MEAFPEWIIILIVVIVAARIAAILASRFGLPTTSVQVLVGSLVGPSAFNVLGAPMVFGTWGSPSPGPFHSALKILAEIGLIQLMFLAGLEVDWRDLKKVMKLSFSVGVWEFGLTAGSVAIFARLFVDRWAEALAIGAIMSVSSFGIALYCLREMKVLGSRVAAVVSGAAIASGLLAILLMIASQATNYGAAHGVFKMTIAVSWFLAKLVMFFAVAYFLISRYLTLSSKSGFLKRPRQMLIGYLLLIAALYAWAMMHFGSFAAVGAASLGGSLLGISNQEVREKIVERFGSLLASIPVGILLIVIGMQLNLRAIEGTAVFLAVMLAAVIGAKLVGCWIAAKGYPPSGERILTMFAVLSQGEMGIVIAGYLFSRGVLTPPLFNVATIIVVLSTVISSVLMKWTQKEKRILTPSLTGGSERGVSGFTNQ